MAEISSNSVIGKISKVNSSNEIGYGNEVNNVAIFSANYDYVCNVDGKHVNGTKYFYNKSSAIMFLRNKLNEHLMAKPSEKFCCAYNSDCQRVMRIQKHSVPSFLVYAISENRQSHTCYCDKSYVTFKWEQIEVNQ